LEISLQSDGEDIGCGAELTIATPVEMRSHGVVAGVVQVPPAGAPIIQMSDANTAGGLSEIAAVIQADLGVSVRPRPGSRIAFSEVDYEEAVAAMTPVNDYIAACAPRPIFIERFECMRATIEGWFNHEIDINSIWARVLAPIASVTTKR